MTVPGCANPLLMYGDAGGYQIGRSLRFNSSDSAYLSRAVTASNRKKWSFSFWIKKTSNSQTDHYILDSSAYTTLTFNNNCLGLYEAGVGAYLRLSAQVFRDVSAWYHILVAYDSDNATAQNRLRFYANGIEITAWQTNTTISPGYETRINGSFTHTIGTALGYPAGNMNAYLAEVFFIDGQALDPSSFTEVSATTGQLVPKAYTGSFGTNGFWLKFSDNSAATATTLGKDYSGNSNNWTPNNLSVTAGAGNDSLVDTPTSYGTDTGAGGEVRGNYCTWNALAKGSDCTLSNGNLDVAWGSAGSTTQGSATIGMSSGKWYWETTITASSASPANAVLGITTKPFGDSEYPGYSATSWGYRGSDGQKWTNTSGSSYGASYANGDVVGVAFDADNGTLTFYKNGSSQGTAFTGLTSGPYFPAIGDQSSSQTFSAASNFGQRPFAYTAPSGFKALVDTNLTAPVVAKPNTVMDVKLYTGNGSTQTISGLGFSPDFVWIKQRSGATSHTLHDTIRGTQLEIYSDSSSQEYSQPNGLTAFNSNGFTLGSQSYYNGNGLSFVSWAWDAGTSTVTNTQGSITSSVRANASAGFSIVTYTGNGTSGATVGHGLNIAPQLLIVKRRSSAGTTANWAVWHGSLAAGQNLFLNTTDSASAYSPSRFTSTLPTSSVFSVGGGDETNYSTGTFVCYAFAPVVGYSSFGTFLPTGTSDSSFVFCGFRPRFLMVKQTSSTSNWITWDTSRDSYNYASKELYPNLSDAEVINSSTYSLDILSNGFKMRNPGMSAGSTWIYCAWAEAPFQYSRAR